MIVHKVRAFIVLGFMLSCSLSSVYAQNLDGGVSPYRDAGPAAGVPHPLPPPGPATASLRILHTNDIHSQYRPEKGPYHLGGIARLASAIRRARASVSHSLLLDGGDWSEGKIYYQLDGGRTAIEMMNALGYDAAVVGNHDWLNGPAQLLQLVQHTRPQFPLLGANLNFTQFAQAAEIGNMVLPSVILNAGPVRVGVIGVCTYEFIYDRYIRPIEIMAPFPIVRLLAQQLKLREGVDLVVVISHNSLPMNRQIADLPFVDLVIHAHDHLKFSEPLVIQKTAAAGQPRETALLVEADKWGRYLGNLDLTIDLRSHKIANYTYKLIQIDETVPEDSDITRLVNHFEAELTSRYHAMGDGDIFNDQIASSEININGDGGRESVYGNLLADAYRDYAHADVAFEQINLTSGNFFQGGITTVDVINALSQVFNPVTKKAWTLSTMVMTGRVLKNLMATLFLVQDIVPGGMPSVSGMHVVFKPQRLGNVIFDLQPGGPVRGAAGSAGSEAVALIEVGGQPLELERLYKIALPQGLLESLEFIEQSFGYSIPRSDITNTGMEDWRILRSYLAAHSPLRAQSVLMGNRLQILAPDLAIYPSDIHITRRGNRIRFDVDVHNYGAATSSPRRLGFAYDPTPADTTDDPGFTWSDVVYMVPVLASGASDHASVEILVPATIVAAPRLPLSARMTSSSREHPLDDQYTDNDGATIVLTR